VRYARTRGLIGETQSATAELLAGGVSCNVVRISPDGAEPFVLKQALPKLRVKADWRSDPVRITREILLMELAAPSLGERCIPRILDKDVANYTFAMASAPLDAHNWKSELMAGRLDERLAAQCGAMLRKLQEITVTGAARDALLEKKFFRELRIDAY